MCTSKNIFSDYLEIYVWPSGSWQTWDDDCRHCQCNPDYLSMLIHYDDFEDDNDITRLAKKFAKDNKNNFPVIDYGDDNE